MKSNRAKAFKQGALLLSLLWLLVGCSEKPARVMVQVGNINAYVELADTKATRRQGLMHRQSLAMDEGMLLAFPQSKEINLWMLNTYVPLDVGFFDERGQLFQVISMLPDGGKKIHKSKQPSRYALEMQRGWFKRHGIQLGALLSGESLLLKASAD